MNKNNVYKLAGVINLFGVCPDFVYPIFENNGKYYYHRCDNGFITSFKELKEELYVKITRFLDFNIKMLNSTKNEFYVGDAQIVAFQLERNKFFVSNIKTFIPFITNFSTDDHILMEEIGDFLNEVDKQKNLIKIKRNV